MAADPWCDIHLPTAGQTLSARRASTDHPFDFFWARDIEGHYLLVMEYDHEITRKEKLPKLSGIEFIEPEISSGKKRLILLLRRRENREIFQRLCQDLLNATKSCGDEAAALQTTLRRAWRWHQLLRGGMDGRLGPEEQKGLIGELTFLAEILLTNYAPADALEFWYGPSGAPKDFSIGTCSIEVKARRGSAKPYVSIASEHQLDDEGVDNLFLYVIDLGPVTAGEQSSFNLNEIVSSVRAIIEEVDPGSVDKFDTRLLEAGYIDEDDYSDRSWIKIGVRGFHVAGAFPRITSGGKPLGVIDIAYKVDLTQCNQYEVEIDVLRDYVYGEMM